MCVTRKREQKTECKIIILKEDPAFSHIHIHISYTSLLLLFNALYIKTNLNRYKIIISMHFIFETNTTSVKKLLNLYLCIAI